MKTYALNTQPFSTRLEPIQHTLFPQRTRRKPWGFGLNYEIPWNMMLPERRFAVRVDICCVYLFHVVLFEDRERLLHGFGGMLRDTRGAEDDGW